jgi:peptidoglycan/xylan/chitin deacetylase (PgdA/CDA1 family)
MIKVFLMQSESTRRSILVALGTALMAALGACSDGHRRPEAAAITPSVVAEDVPVGAMATYAPESAAAINAAAPARVQRITFTPDFEVPPLENGLAPVLSRIPTKHPIVFLTIDDGGTKTQDMALLMAQYEYPASIFLAQTFIQDDPDFFKAFTAQGSRIENHTVSHNVNMVKELNYDGHMIEVLGMQKFALKHYGRSPTLFRPPGGAYSEVMRKAVADAGLRAIITWEAKANAGRMDYQVGDSLRPGDIVLMHFRPEFAADLAAFRSAQIAAGLQVVLLEDFLGLLEN